MKTSNSATKILKIIGLVLLLTPITFKILMSDHALYMAIISGPYPFSMFGGGPFQFWVFGGIMLLGISIVLTAIFAEKVISKN